MSSISVARIAFLAQKLDDTGILDLEMTRSRLEYLNGQEDLFCTRSSTILACWILGWLEAFRFISVADRVTLV